MLLVDTINKTLLNGCILVFTLNIFGNFLKQGQNLKGEIHFNIIPEVIKHWKQMSMQVMEPPFEHNIPHEYLNNFAQNARKVHMIKAIMELIHLLVISQKLFHILLIVDFVFTRGAHSLQR